MIKKSISNIIEKYYINRNECLLTFMSLYASEKNIEIDSKEWMLLEDFAVWLEKELEMCEFNKK